MLGDCATAAARSKNTYIADRHRGIQRRRGRKRAKAAISRTILELAWWIMIRDIDYHDLGAEHFLTKPANQNDVHTVSSSSYERWDTPLAH